MAYELIREASSSHFINHFQWFTAASIMKAACARAIILKKKNDSQRGPHASSEKYFIGISLLPCDKLMLPHDPLDALRSAKTKVISVFSKM